MAAAADQINRRGGSGKREVRRFAHRSELFDHVEDQKNFQIAIDGGAIALGRMAFVDVRKNVFRRERRGNVQDGLRDPDTDACDFQTRLLNTI